MNNKNSNYRVMKFLEPVNKKDEYKGYVRLDIRGTRGIIIVSVENLGDNKSTSEVYLYKDKKDKINIGTVNNKKGMIKKSISFGNNSSNIEDYNVCGVVKDNKIVLYSNLYNTVNLNDIKKLEETIHGSSMDESEDDSVDMEEINEEIENNIEQIVSRMEKDENIDINKTEIAKNNENNEQDVAFDNNNIDSYALHDDFNERVESSSKKPVQKNKFEENLYSELSHYNKLEPLSVNIKHLSWWKIPYDDRSVKNGFLPYYNQIISSYYPFPMANRVTTCNGLIKKYGHYIFGIYKENEAIKKIVYGVPGEFKRDEQPYKGITGFKNWSYKNKDLDGAYGYWLAFADSNTGEVTEPPQIVLGK